ncbi:MAG: diguanylate cyclase [Gammaproteobacteria bacterium]|nr:diguanylate cyclase [Gammaproteobacteria bacterium]
MQLFLHNKYSISYKLLRVVFAIYFSLTLIITAVHIAVEYAHTKNRIQYELSNLEQTFEPALTMAILELNDEQLYAIANGIFNLTIVVGLDVIDSEGQIQQHLGRTLGRTLGNAQNNNTDLFFHQFEIHRKFENKMIYLGDVRIYSDSSVIFDRVKIGFYLIALNAVIKSTILIILFLWVFKKYLFRPITALIQQVAQIDLNNIQDSSIDLQIQDRNELKSLEESFNQMLIHLQIDRDNINELQRIQQHDLELLVIERTRELKQAVDKLNEIAFNDPLTGLKNRRSFIELGNKYMSIAARSHLPLALIMIDIDFFKNINDTYGHAVGDKVLVDFSDKISRQLRGSDLLTRIGGEEFAIIMNNTDCNGAQIAAEKMCLMIEKSQYKDAQVELCYTVSIGVTQMSADDKSIDVILNRADKALYRAKNAGRNQVQVLGDKLITGEGNRLFHISYER